MLDDAAGDRLPAGAGARAAMHVRALAGTRFWLACALLGVLALALRLPTLASRSLWLDETYSAWFAHLPLRELWTRAPLYETHPPLYYTLLKGWSMLAGRSEAGLRSLSVLASVLTVVLIPACARWARLGARTERIALLVALLLAVNAAAIQFAQQARPYALMALAGSLAVFCAAMLARALTRVGARVWPWVLGLALSAGLTLWLHDTGAFAALGIWSGLILGLCLGAPGPRRPQALAVGLAGLGALLVWSPFVPMLLRQSQAMAHLAYWIRFTPAQAKGAWTMVAGAPPLHYPMALLALLGLAWLWRRARVQCWLLACTMALPVLALAAYSLAVKPVFLARLFLWLGPPGTVLAAIGMAALSTRVRAPALAVVLALSGYAVLDFYRSQTEDWRGLLASLSQARRHGDLVLALPNEVQMPATYYLPLGTARAIVYLPAPFPAPGLARRYVANGGAPAIAPQDAARLAPLLAGHRRVWLIERHADLYDPDGLVMRALARRYRLARRIEGDGANLWLFEAVGR